MTQKNNSEQTKIMLPLMTVSSGGREYPVMINQKLCYDWIKRMFFQFKCFTRSNQCSIEEDIARTIAVYGCDFKYVTYGKYEFPSEFKNIIWRTFEQDNKLLTVVIIPLDAIMKECDCNMIGFYTDGYKRIMYTSEYYSGYGKFQLCCFDEMERHMSFGKNIETIEEFRDAVFELNAKTNE